MKFSVKSEDLQKVLNFVIGSVEKKTTIANLANVKIIVSDDELRVEGTDLEMMARSSCPCSVDVPGIFTMPVIKLFDYVKLISGEIKFKVAQEGSINLDCGSSKCRLSTLGPDDFYETVITSKTKTLELSGSELKIMFERSLIAISESETRHGIRGCLITVNGGRITAAATDGVVILTETAFNHPGETLSMVIPSRIMKEYVKAYATSKPAYVNVYQTDRLVGIEIDNSLLVQRLPDNAKFPDYLRLLPIKTDTITTVKVIELKKAIERCLSLAKDASKVSQGVRVSITEGYLELSTHNGEEKIEAEVSGIDKAFILNAEFLKDYFSVMKSEKMMIETRDGFTPIILRDCDDERFICLLQPMHEKG
jgi:DNA polymerase III subunit beta